ncbi:MAG: (Na+)-NQR maturation NqrM [Shewanella sp.]|nr:(Na+)-NQR maturation NqrM [Shewanella sp.]MCF1431483.1 (Na+)-NQR maturation NqrM [Shewanella sp.]MCF1437820.1 (Na+)-NQR maturation NqrM [Shewanella sp.]MCF1459181.1 (Na+)-NQR maturation NqrM [Shewanella sp.]
MSTYLAAFVVLLLFFVLMSIGYIIKRKSVAGSCGGLGTLGIEKACDCDEPCDNRKAKIAAAEEAARQQRLTQNRIL